MSGVFWRAIGAMGAMVVAMAPCGVWAGGRLALLIGNQQYQTQPPLSTPVSDVNLMEATLKSQGFQVEKLTNLTKNQMDRAIQKFISISQGKDIALFYYAGHGEQPLKGGRNFLLPTNADIRSDDDLETEAVLADDVVRRLEDAEKPARFRLVILDACRNNPKSRIRSGRGLAPIQTGDQYTLVGFSTNDRSPALDVATAGAVNSPYAQSLAHWLGQAGQLPLRTIFDRTAREVRSLTKDQQKPRVSGDFPGEVMLSGEVWQPTQPPPVVIPPLPSAGQIDRQCIQNNQICFELAAIPTGTFQMGSPDSEKDRGSAEGPVHTVSVKGFWMGKTEVTQGLWKAVMGNNPSSFSLCGDNCPVETVSWNDVQEFIKKLNGLTGKQYRLPSEAEWEYAARAGAKTAYWWGDKASHEYANYGKDECCGGLMQGRDKWDNVAPVGQFPANVWGLHDMHGNVWEWVQDVWVDNYNGVPTDGSVREGNNDVARVGRGGSWVSAPLYLRSAFRNRYVPNYRINGLGFRLAKTN